MLKYIWYKYKNYEKWKQLVVLEWILKTTYHNGGYLLLFGKKKPQSFEIHRNNYSYFKIGAAHQ